MAMTGREHEACVTVPLHCDTGHADEQIEEQKLSEVLRAPDGLFFSSPGESCPPELQHPELFYTESEAPADPFPHGGYPFLLQTPAQQQRRA